MDAADADAALAAFLASGDDPAPFTAWAATGTAPPPPAPPCLAPAAVRDTFLDYVRDAVDAALAAGAPASAPGTPAGGGRGRLLLDGADFPELKVRESESGERGKK